MALEKWFIDSSRLPVPTNDLWECRSWLQEKTETAWGFSRLYLDARFTNCWFAAADLLREIREERVLAEASLKSFEEKKQKRRIIKTPGDGRDTFRELYNRIYCFQFAEGTMKTVVVDHFGCRALPKVPEPSRSAVFSNLVERARLTPAEVKKILDSWNIP